MIVTKDKCHVHKFYTYLSILTFFTFFIFSLFLFKKQKQNNFVAFFFDNIYNQAFYRDRGTKMQVKSITFPAALISFSLASSVDWCSLHALSEQGSF